MKGWSNQGTLDHKLQFGMYVSILLLEKQKYKWKYSKYWTSFSTIGNLHHLLFIIIYQTLIG